MKRPRFFLTLTDLAARSFFDLLERFHRMDRARFISETVELFHFVKRQVLNQIPSVSAAGGLLAGAWVSSTFTTSPIRGTLASWGLIKGGTHVVDHTTYRLLSFLLPVMAAGVTGYAIHKALKTFRERQLRENIGKAAGLPDGVRAEIREKLTLLEKAREAGLLSEREFGNKKANLYQAYSKTSTSRIEEFILRKLTG